jgi:hypothetical protein
MRVTDSERLRRVEEAQLLQLLYATQMTQKALETKLRLIQDTNPDTNPDTKENL